MPALEISCFMCSVTNTGTSSAVVMTRGTAFSLFSPSRVGFCRPSATLAIWSLVFERPVRSTDPTEDTLVVGFQTRGLFSSLSRLAGAAADVVVDAAGAVLLAGCPELDEVAG